MNPNTTFKLDLKKATLASLVILLMNACSLSLIGIPGLSPKTATPPYPPPPTANPQPLAEIIFNVSIPSPLLPGEVLVLSQVDEVTGLGLNPVNHPMQSMDALHFSVTIPFVMNSVVKYRYVRQTSLSILEDDPANNPVRYRLYYVTGSGVVQDAVASWTDSPFSSPTGRVTGAVVNASNGNPIPNILIAAGGQQTMTDSTGAFVLESILPGTQNLVAYALDGMYGTFQQGALVAADRRTPVSISLTPATLINVVITVSVPDKTVQSAPIRLAGNLMQLGNTFGDLSGGMSTVATRMPVLSSLPDGRYTLTTSLPAGADVRYKYTLGDGFWNAEHNLNGDFVVRQFIVPHASDALLVQDSIETWQAGPSSPITFELTVPPNTPVGDIISLQFNPYGWTEPIPMWPLGNNQWVYTLYSPLNMLGIFEYRYCRNDQCGVADDVETPDGHRGHPISTSLTPQDLQDTVTGWTWLQNTTPGSMTGATIQPRTKFWTGVEFQADYDPTWQMWMPLALQNIQSLTANWAVLTPTWTFSRMSPVVFSPVPGSDPSWTDTSETVSQAHAQNLNVALFPAAHFPAATDQWWTSAPRDETWWNAWFERYQSFAIHHADLATKTGAGALILGGEWVTPALPGGMLFNGNSSGVPANADARWGLVFSAVRQHFKGPLYWALIYPGGLLKPPAFLKNLDGIYLLWNAALSSSATPTVEEMQTKAGELLDADILPFYNSLQKPVVLAAAYPSVTGSATACLTDGAGGCLPWTALSQPNDNASFTVDLQSQLNIYSALLNAINTRSWVGGFVSRGYYPPIGLQDKSASIHGKPAADLLWYWYPRLLGIQR